MKADDIACVLLAAGRGTRFGGGKLAARLAGKPVVHHVAERLSTLPFAQHLIVASDSTPHVTGFERIGLSPPDAPLSRSIASGIAALSGKRPALIALADMPLVPAAHFSRLIDEFDGNCIGTRVAGRIMVPAIFGPGLFPQLMSLEGDRGAAALLRHAPSIPLDEDDALDIDTTDDLARASRLLQGRSTRSTWPTRSSG